MKRGPGPQAKARLSPKSRARAEQEARRRDVVASALRGHHVCVMIRVGGCGGPVVGHEIVKRSQLRNAHLVGNVIVGLCTVHNGWVEDNPKLAACCGLVVKSWAYKLDPARALATAAQQRVSVMMGGPVWWPYWWPEGDRTFPKDRSATVHAELVLVDDPYSGSVVHPISVVSRSGGKTATIEHAREALSEPDPF